jgi:hypothetical protein
MELHYFLDLVCIPFHVLFLNVCGFLTIRFFWEALGQRDEEPIETGALHWLPQLLALDLLFSRVSSY